MIEFLFLIIGLAIGYIAAWLWQNYQSLSKSGQLHELLDKEKELRITAEAHLNAAQNLQTQMNTHFKESFEAMASRAMATNNESFLLLASQTLDKYITKANTDFEQGKSSISNMLNPLHDSLKKHEVMVRELEANSSKTFGSMKTYLEQLEKSQKSLEKETSALVTALKSPKIRGRWGEIGLKRLVEFSGMSEFCDFDEQKSFGDDDNRFRPDLIVNLPGNRKIVIDAKTPLNAYLEALEAPDEAQRNELFSRHAQAVTKHLKDLSSKAYWSQFDNSIDFVILYIEVEPAFGAALIYNRQLLNDALANRIVFATPSTLITLLQTVAYTWKQHTATENALQIWHTATDLYERLVIFAEYLQKTGTQISQVVKTYNQAVGSWQARVLPGIHRLENAGVNSMKKSMPQPEEVDVLPREALGK